MFVAVSRVKQYQHHPLVYIHDATSCLSLYSAPTWSHPVIAGQSLCRSMTQNSSANLGVIFVIASIAAKQRVPVCFVESLSFGAPDLTCWPGLATNLIIEAEKVKITGQENLAMYPDPKSLSGNTVRRFFCKTCGK